MSANASAILVALRDHARAIGVFDVVRVAEFKSEPPNGLCLGLWMQQLGVSPGAGGLAVSSALLQATAQIYYPAFSTPEEDIDLKVTNAADLYLGRLNGDVTLGGLVRNIDILGEFDEPIAWIYGYVTIGQKVSRTATLPINAVINDAWTQVAQ